MAMAMAMAMVTAITIQLCCRFAFAWRNLRNGKNKEKSDQRFWKDLIVWRTDALGNRSAYVTDLSLLIGICYFSPHDFLVFKIESE